MFATANAAKRGHSFSVVADGKIIGKEFLEWEIFPHLRKP